MTRRKLDDGLGRVQLSSMTVAPRTLQLFEQAAAKYSSNGLFMDAVMAALQGLVDPGGPPAKRKKRRPPKNRPEEAAMEGACGDP